MTHKFPKSGFPREIKPGTMVICNTDHWGASQDWMQDLVAFTAGNYYMVLTTEWVKPNACLITFLEVKTGNRVTTWYREIGYWQFVYFDLIETLSEVE